MFKDKLLDIMVKTDALAPVRFLNRGKVPILMYHRFSEEEKLFKISKEAFAKHLEYLKGKYEVMPLSRLAKAIRNGEYIPPNAAVITIDDGYRDAYEIAYPLLREYGMPATLFVVTGFLDGNTWIWTDLSRYIMLETKKFEIEAQLGEFMLKSKFDEEASRLEIAAAINRYLKKLPPEKRDAELAKIADKMGVSIPARPCGDFLPVSWAQAIEMDKNGMDIESHTISHPILTKADEALLKEELTGSKRRLEAILKRKGRAFCYPNGNCTEREFEAAKEAGYECGVTTELRLYEPGDGIFALPRIDAEPEMPRFVQAMSGFDRLKRYVRN